MNRRKLGLGCGGLALAAVGLSGCKSFKGLTSATIPNQVVADLALIKNGLSVVVGAAQGMGLNATVSANILTHANSAIGLISTVAAGMAQSVGQPIVQQIFTDVNAIVAAITGAGIVIPAVLSQVLAAMNTLMPVIVAAVGILTAGTAAMAPPEAVGAARQVLSGV